MALMLTKDIRNRPDWLDLSKFVIQNQNTINWLSVKKEVKIAVYRTLQELLVNMI